MPMGTVLVAPGVEGIMGREHLEKHIFVPVRFLDYKLSWKNLSQVTMINTTPALL